ncbi:hypothetical protein CGI67_24980 [Vibrio parahaemolyticus]|nr:hypothetical protein CGI67_24980 [Vibrio parahaemolyticus]
MREVSLFGAKSLWKFCFRFEFCGNVLSKFTSFRANERLQILSQFGFSSSSGLSVSQAGLVSGLVTLRC